jgi:hypothetical protein
VLSVVSAKIKTGGMVVLCAVALALDAVAALTECLPVRTKVDIAAKAIARNVIPINLFFDFFMLCTSPEVLRGFD